MSELAYGGGLENRCARHLAPGVQIPLSPPKIITCIL